MAITFVLVDDEYETCARIVENICDKIKRQVWIAAVYLPLERQMYWKYLNNIQCEGPSVRCRLWSLQQKHYVKYVNNQQREVLAVNYKINKIAVVKFSMNCTYLCVSWWRRRNVCPYCWGNKW